jgi:hypothetical protein
MVIIMCVGLFFIILAAIVNLIEIRRFLKALNLLNECTRTTKDRILYLPRLLKIIPMLKPLIPDTICIGLALLAGVGGGMMLSILTLGGTCIVTLGIKLFMYLNKNQTKERRTDFDTELARMCA